MISDATKLRQSVLNLLSNAGKFTKDGRVTLNVARERGTTGDWICICIEDNGIGITADNVQKLFKDFNQAEASTATKYGGTGLGLALSQGLCRMMGGVITVESTYGRGSRFTIRVPAYIEDEEGSQRRRGTALSESRALRHAGWHPQERASRADRRLRSSLRRDIRCASENARFRHRDCHSRRDG